MTAWLYQNSLLAACPTEREKPLPSETGTRCLVLVLISMEQSVMVSGIVYVFAGSLVVIGHVQLTLLIMGAPTGALPIIDHLIIFLTLQKPS